MSSGEERRVETGSSACRTARREFVVRMYEEFWIQGARSYNLLYSDISEASLGVVKAIFCPLVPLTNTVTGDWVTGSIFAALITKVQMIFAWEKLGFCESLYIITGISECDVLVLLVEMRRTV